MTNEYGRLDAGAAYDYFRGWSMSGAWSIDMRKNLDKTINPSAGYTVNANIDLEKNDFIEGLNFSESGTLLESFKNNNLGRFQLSGSYHYELPWKKRWTLSLSGQWDGFQITMLIHFFIFILAECSG